MCWIGLRCGRCCDIIVLFAIVENNERLSDTTNGITTGGFRKIQPRCIVDNGWYIGGLSSGMPAEEGQGTTEDQTNFKRHLTLYVSLHYMVDNVLVRDTRRYVGFPVLVRVLRFTLRCMLYDSCTSRLSAQMKRSTSAELEMGIVSVG